MKKSISVCILLSFLWVGFVGKVEAARSPYPARSQDTSSAPDPVKIKADQDVNTAFGIRSEADNLMKGKASASNMRAALPLYARAGQMYERSALAYQRLSTINMATTQDVNGAIEGMNYCADGAKIIQKILKKY